MTERVVETLHARDAVEALLDAYDRERLRWRFEKTGPFWDAVAIAHTAGREGQGRHIAVIDDGFDLGHPALADQRLEWKQPAGTERQHGTAVALLIREVAPRAMLSLYPARTPGGNIDPAIVYLALERISRSPEVSIVNLSVGIPYAREEVIVPAPSPRERVRRIFENRMPVRTDGLMFCDAARELSRAGKLVLAAIGNSHDDVYSPAIDDSVMACGFHLTQQDFASDGTEYFNATNASFEQSLFNIDFALEQPAAALGSSFAAPLLTGFAALMTSPASFPEFARVHRLASFADLKWQDVRDLLPEAQASPAYAASVNEAHRAFADAMQACPHRHYREEPPDPCPECALFCELCYLNWALLRLKAGDLQGAEVLLRAARGFAPNNAKAAANLGFLLLSRAKEACERGAARVEWEPWLGEAGEHYAAAVALRPRHPAYLARLDQIEQIKRGLALDR